MQLLGMFQGWIDFVPEHFLDYEYEPAVQALGWILELYPIAVTILIGAWNVWRLRSEGEDVRFLQVIRLGGRHGFVKITQSFCRRRYNKQKTLKPFTQTKDSFITYGSYEYLKG